MNALMTIMALVLVYLVVAYFMMFWPYSSCKKGEYLSSGLIPKCRTCSTCFGGVAKGGCSGRDDTECGK